MRWKPFRFPEIPPTTCQVCGGDRTEHGHDKRCDLVVSYESRGNGWRGVIRDRLTREPVAICLHTHINRDQSGRQKGMCAQECARLQLQELRAGGRIPRVA